MMETSIVLVLFSAIILKIWEMHVKGKVWFKNGFEYKKILFCLFECLVQQLMSLKNQELQQNLRWNTQATQEETYQCSETISDISLQFNQQKLSKQCHCSCRCKVKTPQANDPQQKKMKKRLKRKNNKMKLKNKQKEQQQKALCDLQKIIKDIYALKSNFELAERQVQRCLTIEINRDKFYEFINSIIRDQVELIRKEIADYLNLLQITPEHNRLPLIKNLFHKIRVIKQASPEIEKIINLFVSIYFNPEIQQPPYQKNLDDMTFSFLIKNYLQKSESFVLLCQIIFQKEEYMQERQLFQVMMNAYNRYDPQDSEEEEEEYSDYGYDSDEWEEENARRTINFSFQEENESKSRKRRERKRRIKQQHQQTYDSIIKRMEQMQINDLQRRVSCNVEEDWIQDIMRKRQSYTRLHNKPFNKQ